MQGQRFGSPDPTMRKAGGMAETMAGEDQTTQPGEGSTSTKHDDGVSTKRGGCHSNGGAGPEPSARTSRIDLLAWPGAMAGAGCPLRPTRGAGAGEKGPADQQAGTAGGRDARPSAGPPPLARPARRPPARCRAGASLLLRDGERASRQPPGWRAGAVAVRRRGQHGRRRTRTVATPEIDGSARACGLCRRAPGARVHRASASASAMSAATAGIRGCRIAGAAVGAHQSWPPSLLRRRPRCRDPLLGSG